MGGQAGANAAEEQEAAVAELKSTEEFNFERNVNAVTKNFGEMVNGARRRLLESSFKLGEKYAIAIGKHDGASIAESPASDDRSGSQFGYLFEIRGQASNCERYYRSRRL